MSIFNRKKEIVKPEKAKRKQAYRRFSAAKNSLTAKFQTSYAKINNQLKSDIIALTLRARDLAKNNEIVSSYINLMIRNVLGDKGFTLNVTSYNENGTADYIANRTIENFWYDYCTSYKHYVTADEQQNANDFDKHILFNFLVDGELFIKRCKDPKSKYTIRYQLIDALDVDNMKNAVYANGDKIVMGIKVDEHYKPLSYFIRKNKSADYYLQGETEEIPADEIIHIYRKQFAGQVRGYTPLAPVIISLAGLEQYRKAEIEAALLSACYMGIWEKNGQSADFEQFEDAETDENGDVAIDVQSGVFRYAPEGYSLKAVQSNHPNSNFGAFFKAQIKGIASSLGVSSNKLNSDYQSVNYSSLRQANSEDIAAWKQLQSFFIANWKDIQFADFLKYLLISDLTNLPYSKIDKFLVHDFRGKAWEYLDPVKEYTAIKLKLDMRLTNPIIELEKQGLDPDDVLNGWELWQQKLKDRGIAEISNSTLTNMLLIEQNKDDEEQSNADNQL